MENTHWRTLLNTKYLAGEELDKEVTVTIEKFVTEEIYSQDEKGKVGKTVLYFKGAKKGMILTNRKAKAISKVVGSPKVADWVGKKIIIYPKLEKHFGEEMLVVTVKIQKVQ